MKGVSKLVGVLVLFSVFIQPIPAQAVTFHLNAKQDQYRSNLVGDWDVATEVTWSDCPYVNVGQVAESKMSVVDTNGVLYPQWQANDWQLVKNSTINISNDDQIIWERSNKLYKDGKYWYVESVDRFDFDRKGRLKAKSLVKQYLDGEYVGSYITESVLSRAEIVEQDVQAISVK